MRKQLLSLKFISEKFHKSLSTPTNFHYSKPFHSLSNPINNNGTHLLNSHPSSLLSPYHQWRSSAINGFRKSPVLSKHFVSRAQFKGPIKSFLGSRVGFVTTQFSKIKGPIQQRGCDQDAEVELDDVWFAYPSRPSHMVLKISIVSQEPTLFNCSIEENIAYGLNGKASTADIENAAKMANAHEFISKFPEQYQTHVGERGVRLSGGQKQRIAIARALLMNPKVLLLDEATSALDAESEYLVQDAMDRLMNGRTVLVIAHRLSTVKSANVVAVISDGQVVESGTHDELLSKDGIYTALVRRQLQGPKADS